MNVPKPFWSEALLIAAYLINCMSSQVLKLQSPFSALCPDDPLFLVSPKVFRCVSYVHIHKGYRSKLDPRAEKCIFLGYPSTQKGDKCYNPTTEKKFVSMDVTFFEFVLFFASSKTSL